MRRARGQAAEARQPLALHARAVPQARTRTRTPTARRTASTARRSSSARPSTRSCKAYAAELGITFFATAFDIPSADFLAELDMPAYKIASADLINTPLLRHVAEIGKPMILSTGGATLDDVRRGYETVAEINPQVALLQCTAGYPAAWEELDLRVIETYRDLFPNTVVGLSSHDNGIAMAVAAYVLGARIVEKHFTLNRALKGTDHRFSLEPQGLRKMVRDLQPHARRARRRDEDDVSERDRADHEDGQEARRGARPARPATTLTEDDIAMKSPGDGLPPYELDRAVGRTLRHPVREDSRADVRAARGAAARGDAGGRAVAHEADARRPRRRRHGRARATSGPSGARALRAAGATVVGIDLRAGRRRRGGRRHRPRRAARGAGAHHRRARRAGRARQQRRHRPAAGRRTRPAEETARGVPRARSTSTSPGRSTRRRCSAPRWSTRAAARSSTSARCTRRSRPSRASTTTCRGLPQARRLRRVEGRRACSLTRYFARRWGPHGVRVNALSPGGVARGQDPEFLSKYCARVPLGPDGRARRPRRRRWSSSPRTPRAT